MKEERSGYFFSETVNDFVSAPSVILFAASRRPRSAGNAITSAIAVLDRAAGGLEYVEQPCASVEDLARVRRRVSVPIAADESIRRAEDPYRVRDLEAADVAVLKVQPLGGVHACLRIAEEIGLPVVVSSALETSVGIAAGVALAAAPPELPYACGLATVQLLVDDVAADVEQPPVLDAGRAGRLAAAAGEAAVEVQLRRRRRRLPF